MSQAAVRVVYDGDALATGAMDVRDLAPALLSFGDLLQETNRVLNAGRAQVSVRVQAEFRRGSFEISLAVTAQGLLEQARTLLLGEDLKAAEVLLRVLFGSAASGGVIGCVIWLLKTLKGKKPDKVTPMPGNRVELAVGNTTYNVDGDVYNVYVDGGVRDALHRTVRPLERPGIDRFEVHRGHEEPTAVVTKEEVNFLQPPEGKQEGDVLHEGTRQAALQLVTVAFEGGLKWRFSEGEAKFHAAVADADFVARVERGEPFRAGDILRVLLRTRSIRTPEGSLKVEHTILEVTEHIPRPHQLQILPPPDDLS